MNKIILGLAATSLIAVSACTSEADGEPDGEARAAQSASATPSASASVETGATTPVASATETTSATASAPEPRVATATSGATWREDPNWRDTRAAEIFYYNRTAVRLPIYSEPDKETAQVLGFHEPNSVGQIVVCANLPNWCKLDFAGPEPTGWVEMDTMTGEAT